MAFENGYIIKDHFEQCIEKYKSDSLIFYKALQIINTFKNHNTWPHNINELENILANIIGVKAGSIIYFGQSAFYYFPRLNESVIWPEDVPASFKDDFIAFYFSIKPLLEPVIYGRVTPLKYYGIAWSRNEQLYSRDVVKFMRMDGVSLELEMDKSDVESLIKSLNQMRQEEGW